MVEKTSVTHPIEVAVIDTPGCTGKLGITICPGKKGNSSFGGEWNRDLNQDISAIKNDFNPDLIVMLMPEPDIDKAGLNLSEIDRSIKGHAIEWIHLPLNSPEKPDENFDSVWMEHCDRILTILRDGGNVLLICRGGLGRSAIIAARILMERGLSGRGAIYKVREARPGAIENKSQEEQVLSYNNFYPVIDGKSMVFGLQKNTGPFLESLGCMVGEETLIDNVTYAALKADAYQRLTGEIHENSTFWAIIRLLSRDGGLKDAGMILLSVDHIRRIYHMKPFEQLRIDIDMFRARWSQLFIDFEECFDRVGKSIDQVVKIFAPSLNVNPYPTKLYQTRQGEVYPCLIEDTGQESYFYNSYGSLLEYRSMEWLQLPREDRNRVRQSHREMSTAITELHNRVKAIREDLDPIEPIGNFELAHLYLFETEQKILSDGLIDWPVKTS